MPRLENGQDANAITALLRRDAYARAKRDTMAACLEYARQTVDAAQRRCRQNGEAEDSPSFEES
ncbi:MAG TPA: hypothetical protein VFQ88_14265 [Nevskiaceae bacterium]|nr:hypothetical protein [Nevskiaceae bacterium]